jgi:hypothetical protein
MRLASQVAVVAVGTLGFVFVGGGSVMTAPIGGSGGGGTVWTATNRGLPGSDPGAGVSVAARDRAGRAALDATGGARVTECEAGDGGSVFDVEVAFRDGERVEVQLDAAFAVVGITADSD